MVDEFTLQVKAQEEWGWLALLDFFLAGAGAGLFLAGLFLGVNAAMAAGIVATAVGAVALLVDLGRPERFWRAISRPGTSWISRGAILVTLFLVFGTVRAAPAIPWFGWLPWTADGAVGTAAAVIAAIAAIGVMAYTGFLLAGSPGIPAWQTALVPVQFVVLSLLAGIGGVYMLLPFLPANAVSLPAWEGLGLGLGVCALATVGAYQLVLGSSTASGRRAGRELVRGRLGSAYLGGSMLAGLLLPIMIIAYLAQSGTPLGAASIPLAFAGLLFILGGLSFRYSLLNAGFYEALLPDVKG